MLRLEYQKHVSETVQPSLGFHLLGANLLAVTQCKVPSSQGPQNMLSSRQWTWLLSSCDFLSPLLRRRSIIVIPPAEVLLQSNQALHPCDHWILFWGTYSCNLTPIGHLINVESTRLYYFDASSLSFCTWNLYPHWLVSTILNFEEPCLQYFTCIQRCSCYVIPRSCSVFVMKSTWSCFVHRNIAI